MSPTECNWNSAGVYAWSLPCVTINFWRSLTNKTWEFYSSNCIHKVPSLMTDLHGCLQLCGFLLQSQGQPFKVEQHHFTVSDVVGYHSQGHRVQDQNSQQFYTKQHPVYSHPTKTKGNSQVVIVKTFVSKKFTSWGYTVVSLIYMYLWWMSIFED